MQINFPIKSVVILLVLGILAYFLLPMLFFQVAIWQRDFNQLMSGYLHQINLHQTYAGLGLIGVSFLYGVFHAIGPGHGKFILATYLTTHQTQLKTSIKLTLLSALTQGFVAVFATSIVVVILNLSSHYFKLSQLWLERGAFAMILLLGLYWCVRYGKIWYQQSRQGKAMMKLQINRIDLSANSPLPALKTGQRVPQHVMHFHGEHCGCGHQHAPNQHQLAQANDWKSQILLVLSIGMRPCSGAIFVLFFAYMIDLYWWGMGATFAMALGTGLTLSVFALLVRYARHSAIKLGRWYQNSSSSHSHVDVLIKCLAGILLIFFASSLLYGTTLPTQGGAVLFGR
ncbi:zinc transporter permease subunit ZevB [Pasteurella sp. PK-2025]|uniref:zinc transporter permease subunit ZevB n=1 Tax=Pasteurella sp. PK-2025 TaxID=3413133 RepID=UPI003C723FCE